MPLVRLQVRNEFGLGQPELYREANREDPKAVLDGIAVAGLVGILRQLGDLADFAAEVFHGLQEQVMTTVSRNHKLMARVQNIEASLPPLEKAVLAQTSHIHFAYTAGCEWHPRIKTARNHFIYNDLPQFIMDSYEECRDPPHLHMLDKFDIGGPGSCLRRYSDPTFFKRVSAYSDEAYSEKFEKARKSRKNKKKRSSRRSGEILRGQQMHSSSGRMQFISPTANGHTSLSPTASTIDMTMKSDMGRHSNSLDSGAGGNYIECVFHPSNYVQSNEKGSRESSSFRLSQKTDILESVSPVMDDNLSHDSLEKNIASSSSGLTWDEKEEIVESNSQTCDRDNIPVVHAEKEDLDLHEDGADILENVNDDIIFDEESNLKPISGRVQTDEIDSEPDNYMDALNTIESESENDLDCETKREVEKVSPDVTHGSIENGVVEAPSIVIDHNLSDIASQTTHCDSLNKETSRNIPDSLQEIPPLISESHVPSLGSPTPSDVPVNEEMTRGLADYNGSESSLFAQVPHVSGSSVLDSSVRADLLVADHTIDGPVSPSTKSDISSSSSDISNLPEKEADRDDIGIFNSKETSVDGAGDHPVSFWTNGGLLGLEPSKPPDFTLSSPLRQASLATKNNVDADHNSMPNSNGCNERDLPAKVPQQTEKELTHRCLTSQHDDQARMRKMTSGCSPLSNGFDQNDGNNLHDNKVMAPGIVLPVALDAKAISTVPNQKGNEISSPVFGLSHRLLMSSLLQKVSSDEKSVADISSKPGILEQSGQNIIHQSLSATPVKEESDYGYPIDSLPPSPALEHMKISFHPISEFETSKLKLNFPGGSNRHESIRDMFPSFQLVPEASISMHDSCFNTDDDDTFCRSSPYLTDDCPSPHSDNDSDQWESDETPESSDHGVHDSFHRTATMESMLSSQELRGATNADVYVAVGNSICAENGVESSLSGRLLDFPSFDNVTPPLKHESDRHLDCNNIVKPQSNGDPTPPPPPPPPPPLPPTQWRVSKPNETEDHISEERKQINDLNHSESNFSLQATPAQVKLYQPMHEGHEFNNNFLPELKNKVQQKLNGHRDAKQMGIGKEIESVSQQGQQKLNGHKEAKQMAIGNEIDEREDFLQQIRTKSFNLRRTVPAKPNATTTPTTNVKVTAILEKANAIRQVVASDDGEDDDTWSDT
ncbi:hypothetical protein L6164_036858 [Bauhinia variegata]|uniref:Uncharacterized protein n=1 Tax=Bauhinia variegata TaxID=167791 RepID=A0ACB9KIF4_BAUVA|nr:hypothetical protein L6164_036858 [Bauhinia variegata]